MTFCDSQKCSNLILWCVLLEVKVFCCCFVCFNQASDSVIGLGLHLLT